MARQRSIRAAVLGSSFGLFLGANAQAAPPGNWCFSVERLFGISRVTTEVETGNVSDESTSTSISLLSRFARSGYSSARLALDYLGASGLTVGGALGYETRGEDDDLDAWVLAPRLGYLARPTNNLLIWPRAGITHLIVERGASESSATALTLEVPFVFLVLGRGLGLSFTPHLDLGIAGDQGDADQTVTELGLQFGLNGFL